MHTLVIGGTGPTGPFIVNGLLARGHQVSILHRGTHDTDEIPRSVERIIGDPHFRETLATALGKQSFDMVIATYGRILHIADEVVGRTGRLITIGGPAVYSGLFSGGGLFPAGQPIPLTEGAPKVSSAEEFRMGHLAVLSEEAVMSHHAAGHFQVTHLRYPVIYGPRQLAPYEWWAIRRFLDGRSHIVLPDSGLSLLSRGYSENMAEAVLLAVDQPQKSAGQIYNCADIQQFTLAQWLEIVGEVMGSKLEIISVPGPLAYPARNLMIDRPHSNHHLLDTHKIRAEIGYQDKVSPPMALRTTIEWYRAHPVQETSEQQRAMAIHYKTEDAMAEIYREMHARLAAVEHLDRPYTHPYPHPKKPQLVRDHQGR